MGVIPDLNTLYSRFYGKIFPTTDLARRDCHEGDLPLPRPIADANARQDDGTAADPYAPNPLVLTG